MGNHHALENKSIPRARPSLMLYQGQGRNAQEGARHPRDGARQSPGGAGQGTGGPEGGSGGVQWLCGRRQGSGGASLEDLWRDEGDGGDAHDVSSLLPVIDESPAICTRILRLSSDRE